jgi:poly(A) polymerase
LREVFREEIAPLGGWEEFYGTDFADGAPRRTYLKLAAFLHDVSKPETKTIIDGRIRFFGHSETGARRTSDIMERFRFSGKAVKLVSLLIEEHLRPTQLSSPGQPPTKKALYRFRRDTGDAALDVLLLSIADHAAARGPDIDWEDWRNHIRYALYVLHNIWKDGEPVKQDRLITGHDLIEELGLAPGKRLGQLLAAIDEAYHSGEVSSRDEALALAKQLAAQESP